MIVRHWLVLALALGACGRRTVPMDSASGSESSATSGSDTSATSSTSVGPGTGGSTASTTETGGVGCADPPVPARADFSLTFEPDVGSIETDCLINSVDVEASPDPMAPPTVRMTFECTDNMTAQYVELTMVSSGFAPPPLEGGQVRLRYERDMPWWTEEWFSLRLVDDPDRLLALGVQAAAPSPPGASPGEFYAPLGAEVLNAGCPQEAGDCTDEIRLGLGVIAGREKSEIFHQFFSTVGTGQDAYTVSVESAVNLVPPIQCSDQPDQWWELLVTWVPG